MTCSILSLRSVLLSSCALHYFTDYDMVTKVTCHVPLRANPAMFLPSQFLLLGLALVRGDEAAHAAVQLGWRREWQQSVAGCGVVVAARRFNGRRARFGRRLRIGTQATEERRRITLDVV